MKTKKFCHSNLWLWFAGIVFATIAAVFLTVTLLWISLFEAGVVLTDPRDRHAPVLLFLAGSLLLGSVMAFFVGKLIIRPVQKIGDAFDRMSHGDFAVRVPEDQKISEIREMTKKFNAMAHDLSHIETLRTDFVANVSHEFKTPLSAIEGYATLLQSPAISDRKREMYIKKILDNSRRLSDMSSNVLLLSKLENQEIVGKNEFRLDEQIRKAILTLEEKWSVKNIEFDLDLPKQIFCGNEALLETVWRNIIDNAIKHSNDGGCIKICIDSDSKKISVTVSDNGDGMSDETQKHIFEKFYQGDVSRKEEGNGLGLALCKRITELSGGEIAVKSALGKGSTFTVTLPTQ